MTATISRKPNNNPNTATRTAISRSHSEPGIPTLSSSLASESDFTIVHKDAPEVTPAPKKDGKSWKLTLATFSTLAKATKGLSNLVLNGVNDLSRFIAEPFQDWNTNSLKDASPSSTESLHNDSSSGSSTYGIPSRPSSTTPTKTPTQSNSQLSKTASTIDPSNNNNLDYYLPDIDPTATMVPLFSGWTAYRGVYSPPKLVSVSYWDDLVNKQREERKKKIKEEEKKEQIAFRLAFEDALAGLVKQDSVESRESQSSSGNEADSEASVSNPLSRTSSWFIVDA